MTAKRVKIGKLDAFAIGVLAALFRWGGPAAALTLQILGVAVGVAGLVEVMRQKGLAAIFLVLAASALWWAGGRLRFALAAKPLDRAARLTTPEN